MTIKINRADNQIEIFETSNYLISKSKEFHPMICKITVFENGHKIACRKRPFSFFYKKFIFKSKKVQEQLNEIIEAEKIKSEENKDER